VVLFRVFSEEPYAHRDAAQITDELYGPSKLHEEEEDTCMPYEEEDTCMPYEEEDTCMSYD
jgi:hypothetical protein